MKTTFTILALLQALIPLIISAEDIKISTINNPILPIELGKTKLVYSKHTFLYYLDLENIFIQLRNLEKSFKLVKETINKVNVTNPSSYHGLAEGIINRAEYLIKEVQNKFENLHGHVRVKRGFFDGVGKLSKWLFGTLDADDEKRYDQAIDLLEKNQENLADEVNLQISLFKRLIDNYNKTIETIFQNQQKLEYHLEIIQTTIAEKIWSMSEYISFHGTIHQIILDCQNVINFIDGIENAIMFSKFNALHNSIISSHELQDMLNYLGNIYEKDEIPKFDNVLSYYQFLGTQVNFSRSKLIFAIHVPILRNETLILYDLLPIAQQNLIYIPKYPYLAHGKMKTQFEKTECPSLEETFYCTENFLPDDNCTLQFLKSTTIRDCPALEVHIQEAIIQQITRDSILVIPANSTRIFSKCSTNQYIDIKTPTLVKIPENCEIKIMHKTFINDKRIIEGKPLILPKYKLDQLEKIKISKTPKLSKVDFQEIHQMNEIAKQVPPIQLENSIEKTSTPIFGSIISILIVTLVLKHAIKKWKAAHHQQENPQETEMTEIQTPENPQRENGLKNSQNHSMIFRT